jgi:hypothetical protein
MTAVQDEQLHVAAMELHGNGKAQPHIMRKVIQGIEEGLSLAQAAVEAEVHPATVRSWRKKGTETDQEPYVTFVRECMRAEAKLAKRCLSTVFEAMQDPDMSPTQLKAATWTLERRFPELWGPKMQVWAEQHIEVEQAAPESVAPERWSTARRVQELVRMAREQGLDQLAEEPDRQPTSEPPSTEQVVQRRTDPMAALPSAEGCRPGECRHQPGASKFICVYCKNGSSAALLPAPAE